MFPTDPISTTEAAMFAQSADLTPSCSSSCFWCVGTVDEITRELDAHGWPDYILQGAYGGKWPLIAPYDPWLLGNATARGVEVITILDSYNDATETQSIPAGYIEITKRYEELAAFLPLLRAKKRRLAERQAEVVAKGIVVLGEGSSPGDGSIQHGSIQHGSRAEQPGEEPALQRPPPLKD